MEMAVEDAAIGSIEKLDSCASRDIKIGTPFSEAFQERQAGYANFLKVFAGGYEGGTYIAKRDDEEVCHVAGILKIHGIPYNLDSVWVWKENHWELVLLNIQCNK